MSDDAPVFDQVNLVVRDMPAMVEFYRRLGAEIASAPAPWDRHHRSVTTPEGIDLDLDSTQFASVWNAGWPPGATGVVLGFRVPTRDAVDSTYADLTAAGYTGQQAPYDAFWGSRFAVVADPDGNSVGLMSPRNPSRRTDPPEMPAD
jgi:catechol 2,3-dioxygenase-like lactoylglutathione lyase family enzyme